MEDMYDRMGSVAYMLSFNSYVVRKLKVPRFGICETTVHCKTFLREQRTSISILVVASFCSLVREHNFSLS